MSTSEGTLMSITDEYVKRAEECERLAGAYIAESNRQILIYAAVHWRMLGRRSCGQESAFAPAKA